METLERQEDYEIRQKIYKKVSDIINIKLDEYFDKYRDNIGFLIYYPLAHIEECFFGPDIQKHRAAAFDRNAMEWIIKKMLERVAGLTKGKFTFDFDQYDIFKNNVFDLKKLYLNYYHNENVKMVRGLNKVQIVETEDTKYKILVPRIMDAYSLSDIYFNGEDNEKLMEEECIIKSKTDEYLLEKYDYRENIINFSLKKLKELENQIKYLDTMIDDKLYELCLNNVIIDVDKLGKSFSSNVFPSKNELSRIFAFLYYLSKVTQYKCSFYDVQHKKIEDKYIIEYDYEYLIKKISKYTKFNYDTVKNCIDYFSMKPNLESGFNEFPLIHVGNKILFIPSSFILNDLQFSIVNGHYDKKDEGIKIVERDKTVSQSVVDKISNKCKLYSNIICVSNRDYHENKVKYLGKDMQSDIDVGLYDTLSNTILIIECKWKENVYLKYDNYVNIEGAVNGIFRKQLGKHEAFIKLSDKNIDFIFEDNKEVINRKGEPDIYYIFVDKRIQYHYDGKHALSEFMFLKLLDIYKKDDTLELDKLVDEINNLKTEIQYIEPPQLSILRLDDGKEIINSIFI
ncbi:hypothetical protein [Candidatus Clostridium radicumherbarum]|uniref:NERD domain-containing protein n=1 Tax=Candidatus Clostridium radicumherbarum TaxID=3381662 RepID=A0ABW8TYK1_9CLOT